MGDEETVEFLTLSEEGALILAPNIEANIGVYTNAVIHFFYEEFKEDLWLDVPITATVEGCADGIIAFQTKAIR